MKQAINNVEDLRQVIRTTIQSLEFVPDTELQEQYTDDENTSITLRAKDTFLDNWHCDSNGPGTPLCQLKVNFVWQPKSTSELISVKLVTICYK